MLNKVKVAIFGLTKSLGGAIGLKRWDVLSAIQTQRDDMSLLTELRTFVGSMVP